jgi:hypothetical protein
VGCMWIVDFFFLLSWPILGGLSCEVRFGYSGGFFGFKMEPTWSEIKHILHRHEEISEANRSTLQLVLVKMGELEQTMENLTLCIESLETKC